MRKDTILRAMMDEDGEEKLKKLRESRSLEYFESMTELENDLKAIKNDIENTGKLVNSGLNNNKREIDKLLKEYKDSKLFYLVVNETFKYRKDDGRITNNTRELLQRVMKNKFKQEIEMKVVVSRMYMISKEHPELLNSIVWYFLNNIVK